MGQKTDIEMRRASLLKAARSAIRLKHAIAADEELNEVLPELERRYDEVVSGGVLPNVAALLRESNVLHDA